MTVRVTTLSVLNKKISRKNLNRLCKTDIKFNIYINKENTSLKPIHKGRRPGAIIASIITCNKTNVSYYE